MKVLIVGPYASPIMQRLEKHLLEAGYDVIIASHGLPSGKKNAYDLGTISSMLSYMNFFKISKIIRKEKPDVVHAHVLNHYGLMCVFSKIPVIVTLWGSDVLLAPYEGRFLKRQIYRLLNWIVLKRVNWIHSSSEYVIDKAIEQCESAKSKYSALYWGFPIKEPSERNVNQINERLRNEFDLYGDDFIVFARGLGPVYDPENCAKIINFLIRGQIRNRIVVLKGFCTELDERLFFSKVEQDRVCYVNRILNADELFCLYSRTSIHFSIPISDNLGGGVIEPAQLGSYPVLSNIPPYVAYNAEHKSYIMQNYEESTLVELFDSITTRKIGKSNANVPPGFEVSGIINGLSNVYAYAMSNK